MSKRWSGLQRDLYKLIKDLPREKRFQIHCAVYRESHDSSLNRYWITIGKETIWERKNYTHKSLFIGKTIREYINYPLKDLKTKTDEYGLYDILKQYDRRF